MSYWRDRVLSQEKILCDKSIAELENHLAALYKSSLQSVEKDLRVVYQRLEKNGEVSINDLYRYNRYWEVRSDINKRLLDLGYAQGRALDKDLVNMYLTVQEYFNAHPKFLAKTERGIITELSTRPVNIKDPLVSNHAKEVAQSVWCADGENYWSRVWKNMDKLQEALEKGLTDAITRGVGPDELTNTIMREFNSSYNQARTLVRTELNHVYNQAAADRYKDAGCKYYEVLSQQSEDECYDMNGTIIRFDMMVEGENCPPFHPNCRCTILPVIGGKNNE